jgi:hypothetical protein
MAGLFLFRGFMAEQAITRIVMFLVLATTVLALPNIGLFYGLHHWTAQMTNGVVDARFIAIANTALEWPLGQVSMVPMLAWIANSAPSHLKATFFAVMASFSNLALSASQLGTKYLNEIFVVSRGQYAELGALMIAVVLIGLIVPFIAIGIVKIRGLRTA